MYSYRRPLLSIVVPVYRSQDCLTELVAQISDALTATTADYEIILVNDFSPDNSWLVIASLCDQNPRVTGVDLRRNFGQDNAILVGIRHCHGEYVAIMDDDLQHDPRDLPRLLEKAREGFDVVFANFHHKHQAAWKNAGSWLNGKIAELMLYKPKDLYLSPYKLIRRDVAQMIADYSGPTPYVDGLLWQVTWRMASIPAEHRPRLHGASNFSFWRSAGVSARLIFSFSIKPMRVVTWIGLFTACLAFLAGLFIAGYRILWPEAFAQSAVGWASLILAVLFVGGVQLFFLGILGEYVGRTYLRVNEKPQTSIREVRTLGTGAEVGDPVAAGRSADDVAL